MWIYPEKYGVIVIGGGHAGCEAAYVSAKKGVRTLLLTMNLDTIAKLSCNPSIGGTAKGHIVREIDAMGGIMGKIADQTSIHYRMLNASKGPAVQAPRAQVDRIAYQFEMKKTLEGIPNLEIKQGTVENILFENNSITGVTTLEGVTYEAESYVVASGTFLSGQIFIGHISFSGGRSGDKPSVGLSESLKKLGLKLGKLKTGTPPRIHKRSIDFSKVEIQPSDENVRFSFDKVKPLLSQTDCFITYTTEQTKEIIQKNLQKSALYSGKITGLGPRYCPSLEDKVVRFSHRDRHQVFLEPEGQNTSEYYLSGMSSSMSFDVQLEFIRSIKGLENAEIMRPAYAIEYDYALSGQIYSSLQTKLIDNLFLAGQINGTTGYEEAAGQGLIAGINAANKAQKKEMLYLPRASSYLGVMIDDLISKDLLEPYRMFTSRAEHRLILRQDNALLRLFTYAYQEGLISEERYKEIQFQKELIEKEKQRLETTYKSLLGKKSSLSQILCHKEFDYQKLLQEYPLDVVDHGKEINNQIQIEINYAGYITRQEKEIAKFEYLDKINIPKNFTYDKIIGLRNEAKEKLKKFLPENLSVASRLAGISPADISILMIMLKKNGA